MEVGGVGKGGATRGRLAGCTLQIEDGASDVGDDDMDSHRKACTPPAP